MRCPKCGFNESKVLDTRSSDDGARIRRKRECGSCTYRFVTYETLETTPITVIKKDGNRELFNPDKLFQGMLKSCEKRPVPTAVLNDAVAHISNSLQNCLEKEVTSTYIGELCMDRLKEIDQVAYVRFASVYRQFQDVNSFFDELKDILQVVNNDKADQ